MTDVLAVRTTGDVSVLDIKGEVTPTTGALIEAAYKKVTQAGAKKILLAFDRETYINSGGIAILIGIVSESRKHGQTIRMTGLSAHFQKIFTMVGLTRYSRILPSEEAALADF